MTETATPTTIVGRLRSALGLRTRLRAFRRARGSIAYHRHHVGLRRAITFWRWSSGPPSRHLIDLHGQKAICRFGSHQSDIHIWYEVFDDEANSCVDLDAAAWIIDAGANVGYTALWFAQRYPMSQIIAIEPDAESFEILSDNAAHEPRIHPIRAAVTPPGAPRQRVVDGVSGPSPASFQTVDVDPSDPADEMVGVEAVDIASVMEQFGIERLDLLKMDIEGAEQAVFADCDDWIDRVEAIIVEVHDRFVPGCSETFDRATADFAVRDVGPEGSFRVYVRRGAPSPIS